MRFISAITTLDPALSWRRLHGWTTAPSTACEATGVIGTYLHGALENPRVCAEIFGIVEPEATSKASRYQQMATWFARHARQLDDLGVS